MMDFDALTGKLAEHLGAPLWSETDPSATPGALIIQPENLLKICEVLQKTEGLYFDLLSCIVGLDNGPEKGSMEVIYILHSIPYGHKLMLRMVLGRNKDEEPLPVVPSVSGLWKTALWHEREVYDLFGIHFEGHPDLRRILLPSDWEGHPLRKDYQHQEKYHGIKVAY